MQVIYARQSADKKDSISIDTQIAVCRSKLTAQSGEEVRVYADRGFSGKSTDRPEFQKMMGSVRSGAVSRIVVYKLDRISRSLMDFLSMRQEFASHGVALISCMEDFDTSTSVGRLMLNILMMFAEMERETIQRRIRDNYYARGEQGFYLGGHAPFGYRKVETQLLGKKTCTFAEDTDESPVLKEMYAAYAQGDSLSHIARRLTESGVRTRRGSKWSEGSVARMLKNPVYVKANADIRCYLEGKGATVNNPLTDFCGEKGLMLYGCAKERRGGKFSDVTGDHVTVGMHDGIIDPSLWLDVQRVFEQKKRHSNLGTGSLSWLQGLVKCACGYSCYVKKSGGHRYFYCRGRRNGSCPQPRTLLDAARAEEIVGEALFSYLEKLSGLPLQKPDKDDPRVNRLKISSAQIDAQIVRIVETLSQGSEITIQYLNQSIEKLHRQKQKIADEIAGLEVGEAVDDAADIAKVPDGWAAFDMTLKKAIVKCIVNRVVIDNTKMKIVLHTHI